MKIKRCKDCQQDKPLSEFYMAGGCPRYPKRYPNTYCKSCSNVRLKKNHDNLSEVERKKRQNASYHRNKKACQTRAKRYRQTDKCKKWFRDYASKKYRTDLDYRLRNQLRHRLRSSLKCKTSKTSSALKLLDCSMEQFRQHIASLFQPGMSWENWGTYRLGGSMTWHIDHIKPCSSFNLTDPEQQKQCFHWKNMQPLWAVDNIRKGDLMLEEGLL